MRVVKLDNSLHSVMYDLEMSEDLQLRRGDSCILTYEDEEIDENQDILLAIKPKY